MIEAVEWLRRVDAVAMAGGGLAIVGGAFALGLRHGIDWDHIAAITDITSTTTAVDAAEEALTREPGLQLTDEAHHRIAREHEHEHEHTHTHTPVSRSRHTVWVAPAITRFFSRRREPLLLGMMYALGHATVVIALGLLAILAAGVLPAWIDPIMGRIVGATLIFLSAYLYFSIYQYFRGGTFRIRSRWMIVFAGVRTGYHWFRAGLHGHTHHEVTHVEQYGVRTAFGIGVVHGIGAETGTQVLVIAAAAGAASQAAGVVALGSFVIGLLLSNALVTVATSAGFVSAQRRQWLYVVVGLLAATFSLLLGLLFLGGSEGLFPGLEPYFQWIGGPR